MFSFLRWNLNFITQSDSFCKGGLRFVDDLKAVISYEDVNEVDYDSTGESPLGIPTFIMGYRKVSLYMECS